MKTIGIIGGMSWESTIEYYRIINEEVNKKLGKLHGAKLIIESYDFQMIEELQRSEKWEKMAEILSDSAEKLENYGADIIIIATNTMHKVADIVQKSINIPLYHIADATAEEIIKKRYSKPTLLGTKFTVQQGFYIDKLTKEYNIDILIPEEKDQDEVHRIIFDELCKGEILEKSRQKLIEIVDRCKSKGADSAILGCTELPNILKTASLPLINTAEVHCIGVVKKALS